MKAQGVRTRYLALSIIGQSLIVGVIGVGLAFILGYLTSLVLPAAMPYAIKPVKWLLDGVVLVAVSIIGGLFSIRTVTKVDPVKAIGGE